ncbi:type VI secretion system amidase effector protein Tae4 [Burkholderia cenocepacia]|uniref:type VI secretion system amidase effector protein Tae4 n=1 Tax=Burkholderia cenocepacia TaxID=95486 RepID=UPI002118776F|nr:type VI secretion system amidase effector protein Tae4 [Burkholderia cenocepacia]
MDSKVPGAHEPSRAFDAFALESNSSQQQGAKVKRPSFAVAWAASQRIYDPANSGERVAKVIGGYVEKNVNNPNPTERWSNTCAVRMSYILGEAGMVIPRIPEQTVPGRDNRQYFFRVRDLIRFLEQRWGKAEGVKYPPSNGGLLAGRQGVILFEVSGWSDAQGHATLFNGRTCYDHCYFNEPGARYRTDRANFWSLS